MQDNSHHAALPQTVSGWQWAPALAPFLISLIYILAGPPGLLAGGPAWLSGLIGLGLLVMLLAPVIGDLRLGLLGWAVPGMGFLLGLAGLLIFNTWIRVLPFLHADGLLGKALLLMLGRFIFYGHMLILCLLLAQVATRLPRLRPFETGLRRDGTLFSFLVYNSLLPVLLVAPFEAYRGAVLYHIAGLLVLAAGAWFYLGRLRPGLDLPALLFAIVLAAGIFGLGRYALYPYQPWTAAAVFPRWWEAIVPLIESMVMLIMIVAPARGLANMSGFHRPGIRHHVGVVARIDPGDGASQ